MIRLLMIAAIVLAAVGCDQSTKHIARTALEGRGAVHVLGDFFILDYAENQGAFLSLGAGWPRLARSIIFGSFSLLVVAGAAAFAVRKSRLSLRQTAALSLLIGGGAGNLLDRLTRGGLVSDFMNLGIGPVRTGIFNVADLCLMAGAALILFDQVRRTHQRKSR